MATVSTMAAASSAVASALDRASRPMPDCREEYEAKEEIHKNNLTAARLAQVAKTGKVNQKAKDVVKQNLSSMKLGFFGRLAAEALTAVQVTAGAVGLSGVQDSIRNARARVVADAALKNDARFNTKTAAATADPKAAAARARQEAKVEHKD